MRNYDELAEQLTEEFGMDYLTQFDLLVTQWAEDRGIFAAALPAQQLMKTREEVEEIGDALIAKDRNALRDAIGDTIVTLVIQARMNGLELQECMEEAWHTIKNRTGRTENGIFIKEE